MSPCFSAREGRCVSHNILYFYLLNLYSDIFCHMEVMLTGKTLKVPWCVCTTSLNYVLCCLQIRPMKKRKWCHSPTWSFSFITIAVCIELLWMLNCKDVEVSSCYGLDGLRKPQKVSVGIADPAAKNWTQNLPNMKQPDSHAWLWHWVRKDMTSFRILFGMCLKGIGKAMKPSIEIGGFQVDVWTGYLPATSQDVIVQLVA